MMVNCPFHNDTRPSMKIYGDFAFCFCCRIQVPVSELDLPERTKNKPKPDPTNIPERLKYIKALPTKLIRGFELHYDQIGFYIQWPLSNYYKRRNWSDNPRYTAPAGVKPPLFSYEGGNKHLIVVEGELNAMSLHSALYGEYKIVSPGPASDFMRHLKYFLLFNRITFIMDHDAAGIIFGCQIKDRMLRENKYAHLITVTKDYNDILQESGEEGVREQFERDIR